MVQDDNMYKLIITLAACTPLLLLSGCTVDNAGVDTVVYDPGYSNDYVYSVGYYSNRPYWGNNYYYSVNYGYDWPYGYWGGGYYNGF
jgi:hypothetical protein